jgi:hypothetical protein
VAQSRRSTIRDRFNETPFRPKSFFTLLSLNLLKFRQKIALKIILQLWTQILALMTPKSIKIDNFKFYIRPFQNFIRKYRPKLFHKIDPRTR